MPDTGSYAHVWTGEKMIAWMEAHPDVVDAYFAGDADAKMLLRAYWETWYHPCGLALDEMQALTQEWEANHTQRSNHAS